MKRCAGSGSFDGSPKIFREAAFSDGDGAAAARRTCLAAIRASRETCDGDGSDSNCVFIDASAAAVAAVDFCSMSSTVEDDDLFEEPDDEEFGHVYVLGAIWPVRLSRQVILKQIARRLDLHVYGFGVVIEDARAYRGWIDMDIPPSGFGGVRSRQKFYGQDSGGKYDAMESVCETVIGHMVTKANVEVMDVNYEKMKIFKGEAATQRRWSTLLSEFLGDAKTEAAAMRRRCGKIFFEMKRLCDELGGSVDIQSIRCSVDEGARAASAVEPKCIGTSILDAWLESFASRLAKLINEGTDIVGIAGGK